jgi:hypothetical protein
MPHPPLSPRRHRCAPSGKARALPSAVGLPLPLAWGIRARWIRPAAVRLEYCPLSSKVNLGRCGESLGQPRQRRPDPQPTTTSSSDYARKDPIWTAVCQTGLQRHGSDMASVAPSVGDVEGLVVVQCGGRPCCRGCTDQIWRRPMRSCWVCRAIVAMGQHSCLGGHGRRSDGLGHVHRFPLRDKHIASAECCWA